jgi:Uma2 family endonuclease
MRIEEPTYRFTVEEFHKLAEAGILDEDDRVELLDGELVIMSPIGYRHALTVNRLNEFFVERSRRRYLVSPQNPVVLAEVSEPQPDVVLVRRSSEVYQESNPHPKDVFLLIEVADASLPYNRGPKLRAYARAGISEFWIVNLAEDVIETYREPAGESYQTTARFGRGQTVAPLAFPDLAVAVSDIVP